jgi:hypothetical protein
MYGYIIDMGLFLFCFCFVDSGLIFVPSSLCSVLVVGHMSIFWMMASRKILTYITSYHNNNGNVGRNMKHMYIHDVSGCCTLCVMKLINIIQCHNDDNESKVNLSLCQKTLNICILLMRRYDMRWFTLFFLLRTISTCILYR